MVTHEGTGDISPQSSPVSIFPFIKVGGEKVGVGSGVEEGAWGRSPLAVT